MSNFIFFNRKIDVNNVVRKEKVYYKGEVVDEKNY